MSSSVRLYILLSTSLSDWPDVSSVGIIEEVGPEVTNFSVGDRVAVSAVIACGKCMYCQKELFSICDRTNPSKLMEKTYGHRTAGLFGYSHLTGGYEGGQAEYARVPIADVNCLKLPNSISDEKALMMCDVACTSYMAADYAEIGPGKSEVRLAQQNSSFE
jgi:threonine dehydrogenase-like Zn-dependent dehydrogenase